MTAKHVDALHPIALDVLDAYAYATHGHRLKRWNKFAEAGADPAD